METVTIRRATEADVAGLVASRAELAAEDAATRDPLRNTRWVADHGAELMAANLADPDRLVLAAADGTRIVGHLLGAYLPPSDMWTAARASLVTMSVSPEQRGSGVGTRLVDAFKAWAAERGAVQLRVTAYAENEGAIRFYRRHGFAPLEVTLAMTT